MRLVLSFLIAATLLILSGCSKSDPDTTTQKEPEPAAYSLTGEALFSPEPSRELLERYDVRREAYSVDHTNIDNIIWFGRFMAYIGDYEEAISIYTQGLELHPDDARLYRHRGHRYITIRKFDEAIADLEKAVELIEGTENEVEPDGMPNAQGIPVSSLHGNIWYHLGLAYYLKHDLEGALRGFHNGRATSGNADNLVSTSHWLYMINRRMGEAEKAEKVLDLISSDMEIIENFAYHQLLLFYKGELSEEELTGEGSAGDAITYGVANWHLYNNNPERAREVYDELLGRSSWASFGYIAAESDLLEYFSN